METKKGIYLTSNLFSWMERKIRQNFWKKICPPPQSPPKFPPENHKNLKSKLCFPSKFQRIFQLAFNSCKTNIFTHNFASTKSSFKSKSTTKFNWPSIDWTASFTFSTICWWTTICQRWWQPNALLISKNNSIAIIFQNFCPWTFYPPCQKLF